MLLTFVFILVLNQIYSQSIKVKAFTQTDREINWFDKWVTVFECLNKCIVEIFIDLSDLFNIL